MTLNGVVAVIFVISAKAVAFKFTFAISSPDEFL